MLPGSADDFTFIVSRHFSNFPEVRPSTIGAHGSVVQNSAGEFVLEHAARFTLAGIDKITCLVDAAAVVLALVSERHDQRAAGGTACVGV